MREDPKIIKLESGMEILDSVVGRIATDRGAEKVPVRKASGRVLSADVRSSTDLPPFNRAAVDGYAILDGDESSEYMLIETVKAGEVPTSKLVTGAAIKVMTGAPVPDGAGRIVMVEDAEEAGGVVNFQKIPKKKNIALKGEDTKAGNVIFHSGRRLELLDVVNLIGCGIEEVEVAPPVRVFIISTGDEIVDSASELSAGKIMNTNGPLMRMLSDKHGLKVSGEAKVGDDREPIKAAIVAAAEASEIIVITGGVSAGDFDFVPHVLSELGFEVHFSRLSVKPGKPMTFASSSANLVFGLPGNPVSAYVMFHVFVLRAAAILLRARVSAREIKLPLASEFKRRTSERTEYVPCNVLKNGTIEPVNYHGSGHLLALSDADGFFVAQMGVAEIDKGDKVVFLPTEAWFK